MNRIRTIATAGIVAGSVAFAAALISSGGVGASFVDAAEAGASITVADHLDGLQPEGCTFDFWLPDWPDWSFGKDHSGTFNPSDFAKDLGNGTWGTTLDFSVSGPDTDGFDLEWSHKDSDGDLEHSISFDKSTHHGSIEFWWPQSPDRHVWGAAFIEFLCTVVHEFHGFDHTPGHGGKTWSLYSKSDDPPVLGVSSSDGVDSDPGSDPSAGGIGDTPDSTTTYSFQAVIDLAAEPTCTSTEVTTSTGDESTPTTLEPATSDPGGCATGGETTPDCTPNGADAADHEKCPSDNPLITTEPPGVTASSGTTETTSPASIDTSTDPSAATTTPDTDR